MTEAVYRETKRKRFEREGESRLTVGSLYGKTQTQLLLEKEAKIKRDSQ